MVAGNSGKTATNGGHPDPDPPSRTHELASPREDGRPDPSALHPVPFRRRARPSASLVALEGQLES